MNKKHKILISASIFLNIVLILVVVMSVNQLNYVTNRTLITNATDPLFKLHDTISKQENENWSDLDFLSNELEETSTSVAHALTIGVTSKTIDKDDTAILLKLSIYFERYSYITNSEISPETLEEMKLNLIRFNTLLTQQGFDNEGAFDWTKENYLKKLRTIVSGIEKAEGIIINWPDE
ncbi:hypothetical protein [Lysinibacillus sp. 54212]|uniref:hypothetical protein n=1 Tax=Lysinibacillus sp. 54212 TaxID=3119829 RepID=UPI002FC93E7F